MCIVISDLMSEINNSSDARDGDPRSIALVQLKREGTGWIVQRLLQKISDFGLAQLF